METLTINLDHNLQDDQIKALLTSYIITHEKGKANSKIKTASDFEIVDCLINRKGPQDLEILVGYNRIASSTGTTI